jgi:quercetin dioxygenase-like cupin family protein
LRDISDRSAMSTASERTDLDVEHRSYHAQRPGFRITELRIGPTQRVPWHRHSHISDTFYVLDGRVRLNLRDPDEEIVLEAGQVWGPVSPGRPHLVTNAGEDSATFLVLQGLGDYDFVPLD